MSCPTNICNARCCYNIPFDRQEYLAFSDKIVNPIVGVVPLDRQSVTVFTNIDPNLNKCPFLTNECKCNIYDQRPDVCRKFGEIPQLKCKYIKNKSK